MSTVQERAGQKEANANTPTGTVAGTIRSPDGNFNFDPPSPGVDVHALFGIPRAKRPSEKSDDQKEELEDSDTDDLIDSDDDEFEDFQEGEYLVMEDSEDSREIHVKLLAEQADLHRQILLPVFVACTAAYDKWVEDNKDTLLEAEMAGRRAQLELYRKVLELYGSDEDWGKLTHEQKVTTDKEVLEVSERAKDKGPPPDVVSAASIAAGESTKEVTVEDMSKTTESKMQNLKV